MAAKRKIEKKPIRIPKGSMYCYGDSIGNIVECLLAKGFTLADLNKTSLEFDWCGCYYPDDSPSISVEWGDIE